MTKTDPFAVHIKACIHPEDFQVAKPLLIDFLAELPVSVDFQNVDAEIEDYPNHYISVLLAVRGEEAVGVVALKDQGHLQHQACEMKRLYVKPNVRHLGVGEKLCQALMQTAYDKGFQVMLLDTLERLTSACKLYKKLGFQTCEPYYDNPIDDVIYMQKKMDEVSKV